MAGLMVSYVMVPTTLAAALPMIKRIVKKWSSWRRASRRYVVKVGRKPLSVYIRAVVVGVRRFKAREVVVQARGSYISKAVDVVEIIRNKALKRMHVEVKSIKIGTEILEYNGKPRNVSTIEIVLSISSSSRSGGDRL